MTPISEGVILKWNGKSLKFESISDFGESIQTEDIWTSDGWKKFIASDYVSTESIRLHARVEKSSSDLKSFLTDHSVTQKSNSEIRDCTIEYANASGLFSVAIELKNAFVVAVEWSSLKAGTDLRVVVEIAFDSLSMKTLLGRPSSTFKGTQSVGNLSSIKAKFKYDNRTGPTEKWDQSLYIRDKVSLDPRYWASVPTYRLSRTMGSSTNPLRDGQSKLSALQPDISHLFDPTGDISKREEYVDLAFYIYSGFAGAFEASADQDRVFSLGNALEVFAIACSISSMSSNIPAKDVKPLLEPSGTDIEKDMALPKVHSSLKYPADLFSTKSNGRPCSLIDSTEKNTVSQLLEVKLPDFTTFSGVLANFDFEIDRFDERGCGTRALVRMSLLGINSINSRGV